MAPGDCRFFSLGQINTIINTQMETKHKELYESPTTEIVETQMQQMLCTSEKTIPQFGEGWTWD